MHRRFLVNFGLAVLGLPDAGMARTPAEDATRTRQAFDVRVPYSPTAAAIGSTRQLFYEVHLTSFARVPLEISAMVVEDAVSGRVVYRLEGEALAEAVGGPGIEKEGGDRRFVTTGRRAIVYLQIPLDDAPPTRLRHRVEFEIQADTGPVQAAVVGGAVTVGSRAAPVLGPPLSGGPWVAVYDPTLENGHRRYVYAVGGKARIPGRFAIDWMRPVAPPGSPARDRAVTGADAPVLAVADAVVVGLRNGVADIAAGQPRPPLALADATGNYVALDLGGGRYAFYEHLAPGLSVKLGSRVRRGQIIARVGSTGQASRPHLHFHVADALSPLGAEGEPYCLVGARIVGAYRSIATFEAGVPWRPVSSPAGHPTLPPPNSVIMFDRPKTLRSAARPRR